MKLHFLLAGAVAIGLLASAPDSMAHGGGGGGRGGGGGGRGGSGFHGGFHSGGFHGRHFFHGRFFGRGRFFGPGFGFYGYPYPWWGWDYPYYPYYGYYGYDSDYGNSDSGGYASGAYEGDQQSQFSSTRAVQAALAWRGYYSGRIDGVMGPETSGAIRSFQAHQGLPVTGQIDSGLMNALRQR